MGLYIKQGVNESIELELPFDVSLLTKFTMDLFQNGRQVLSKAKNDCTVEGNTVTAKLSQHDTLLLAPQRASLNFRGLYTDGGTVVIEDIPCVISRGYYRAVAT